MLVVPHEEKLLQARNVNPYTCTVNTLLNLLAYDHIG